MSPAEFANLAIVVPFVDHGRGWSGWDCWGMVQMYYREVLGVEIPSYVGEYTDAGRSTQTRRELAALIDHNMTDWREVDNAEAGDVVLLKIGGRPIHVGIAVNGGQMLHTETGVDTLVERLASPMWERRIEGFYRYDP